MRCVKTMAASKQVVQRCAPTHGSCNAPNAVPVKYSKGIIHCKKGKAKPVPAPKDDDAREPKIDIKDGQMDITLSDGYSSKKSTAVIIERPEFTPGVGGSVFSQLDPTMVGYEPE